LGHPVYVAGGCSVYGNGNEFDGPHPIPLGYKQIRDFDVILKVVGERVGQSVIGAVRAYVRNSPSHSLLASVIV